jgi:opacity protein-like surface antigen
MKLRNVVSGAAAAFASLALVAPALAGGSIKDEPAKVPGIYVEVGAGAGWYPDTTWGGALSHDEQKFKDGEVFRLAVGTRLSYGLRGEIEGAYRSNFVKNCNCDSVFFNLDGGVRTYSVMGNLFYDFKLGRIQPFIGAGAGWAHLDVDTNFTGFNFIQARGTDDRFAYQLMAGVAVPLGETVSLTARYTYFDTVGDKMTALNGSGAGTSVSVDLPYSNHSVTVGLRFGF